MSIIKIAQCNNIKATLYIAALDYDKIIKICENYCDKVGLCVSITKTDYIYTGGKEKGVAITLINYARFPTNKETLINHLEHIANEIGIESNKNLNIPLRTFSIITNDESFYYHFKA